MGAFAVGAIAGCLFVGLFIKTQNTWKIDDVLGVWPLHGLCGTWGGIAAGIFGQPWLGGLGGVSFQAQLLGTLVGVLWAVCASFLLYSAIKAFFGLRLSQEEEFAGADMSIHKISATPDRESSW
jgi:Amt family ammonium transporter